METAVVVPTLNSRDQLAGCLDALERHAPEVEVIVVNGPSTDGTSGLARSHTAVDRLLEVAERNLNVARNAGIQASAGEAICFVAQDSKIESGWLVAMQDRLEDGAGVVTGPVHRRVTGGVTTETVEEETVCGRKVRYFDGGNVGFRRSALEELDGFDEYLDTGAARDAAHRLAGLGREITWEPAAAVERTEGDDVAARTASGESNPLGLKFRSMAYRSVKNYGLGPRIIGALARHLVVDGVAELRGVAMGEVKPSAWVGNGRRVLWNLLLGMRDGRSARRADRSPRLNPHGVSSRSDRVVASYDC